MRPKIGDIVVSSDGLRGRVIEVVDEDPRWGGPWAARIEYQFEDRGDIYTLHEWVTTQEWGDYWKPQRALEHQPFDYDLYLRYHSEDRETREEAVREIAAAYQHQITFDEYISQDIVQPYELDTGEILWTHDLRWALKHLDEIRAYREPVKIPFICLGYHK